MKELRTRKKHRLEGYDYSQDGAYFITLCVKDHHWILGEVVGRDALGAPSSSTIGAPSSSTLGAPSSLTISAPSSLPYDTMHVELSEYGKAVAKEIIETPLHYPDVSIDNYTVMPNHVHMIIVINRQKFQEDGAPAASRPTTALIPKMIAMLKKKTNGVIGFNIWQTSYHDHIIRSEAEYRNISHYIDVNPAKWREDRYFIQSL